MRITGHQDMHRRRSGFTLLELLTTIAILALLMGILLPSLRSARQQAKATTCQAHLKEIGNMFQLYIQTNEEVFPPVRLKTGRPTDDENNPSEYYINHFRRAKPRWQWFIVDEDEPVVDPKPFERPIRNNGYYDDSSPMSESRGRSPFEMTLDYFLCPSLADEEFARNVRNGAYGYNYQYLGNTRKDALEDRWDNFPVKIHQIRASSGTVLVADSRGAGRQHGEHSYTLDPPRLATEKNAQKFGPHTGVPSHLDQVIYAYSPAEQRHRGQANVLYTDFHVESNTHKELGYRLVHPEDVTNPRDKNAPFPVLEAANIQDQVTDHEDNYASNKLWTGTGGDEIALQVLNEP